MIKVIYKKEIKLFFQSPLFYLIASLTSLLLSIPFIMGLNNFSQMQSNAMFQMQAAPQQLNIHYAVFLQHLSFLNLLFIFFIPALAMRLIAEERKNRTFDLLMTSPITSVDIVIGKFLSLMTVVIALSAIAFFYILLSRRLFEFTWTTTLISFLGIFLVASVYAVLGLFASSLSENTLIAFILGIVFNISIWIFGGLSDLFDGSLSKTVFNQISLNNHLQSLIEGAITTEGLIFFFSLIFLFGFITERVIESSRWRIS